MSVSRRPCAPRRARPAPPRRGRSPPHPAPDPRHVRPRPTPTSRPDVPAPHRRASPTPRRPRPGVRPRRSPRAQEALAHRTPPAGHKPTDEPDPGQRTRRPRPPHRAHRTSRRGPTRKRSRQPLRKGRAKSAATSGMTHFPGAPRGPAAEEGRGNPSAGRAGPDRMRRPLGAPRPRPAEVPCARAERGRGPKRHFFASQTTGDRIQSTLISRVSGTEPPSSFPQGFRAPPWRPRPAGDAPRAARGGPTRPTPRPLLAPRARAACPLRPDPAPSRLRPSSPSPRASDVPRRLSSSRGSSHLPPPSLFCGGHPAASGVWSRHDIGLYLSTPPPPVLLFAVLQLKLPL